MSCSSGWIIHQILHADLPIIQIRRKLRGPDGIAELVECPPLVLIDFDRLGNQNLAGSNPDRVKLMNLILILATS